MPKLKSIFALSLVALALSACGKSSDNSGTAVYGGVATTAGNPNFIAECSGPNAVLLPGLSSAGTQVCEVLDAQLGGVSLFEITFGTVWVSTPLSVNAGDTITVENPSGNLSFAVAGVTVVPAVVGTSVIFQAPAAGFIQYGYSGTGTFSFSGITVQTCTDQNGAVYACP